MTEPGPTADAAAASTAALPATAVPVSGAVADPVAHPVADRVADPVPDPVADSVAGPIPDPPARPVRHHGLEGAAARSAVVALVAGAALAVSAARAVDLLIVVAVIQGVFVIAWVQGAAVAVVPGESFDGPEGEVEMGPPPALLSSVPAGAPNTGPGDPRSVQVMVETDVDERGVDEVDLPVTDDDEREVVPLASAMPGRIGALLIGGGAAAAADYAVSRWPHSALSPMLGILGLAVPVMFAHQLVRGVVRARVVESLSDIAMIVVAVVALPSLVQLRHEIGGGHMAAATALASAVAVAVGLLVDLIWSRPRFDPDVPRGLTGVVVATVFGAALGAYLLRHLSQFSTLQTIAYSAAIAAASALVAVATSLVAYSAPRTASLARGPRLLRPVALALLPMMLVAPGAYVLLLSA